MGPDLRTLALAHAADLAPAGTQAGASVEYDERAVDGALRNASRRTVESVFERYGAAGLMMPRTADGPRPLVAAATATEIDALRWDARPLSDAATDGRAGYLIVQVPVGMLRHVRLSLVGRRAVVATLRTGDDGPDAGFSPLGSVRPYALGAPRPDETAGYLVTHSFAASPTQAPEFTSAVALTPYGAAAGGLDPVPGAPTTSIVAEWVYVRVPEPEDMTDGLLDAAAWLAASFLLSQDPETLSMSDRAMQHHTLALNNMSPRAASVVVRRPRPFL